MDYQEDTLVSDAEKTGSPVVVRQPAGQAVWWVIAASLAVIAVCLVMRLDSGGQNAAWAQSTRTAGARGVYSFTGQISKTTYGVFMVDVDAGTLWCYEILSGKGSSKLSLVAARDWRMDRYLKEFSTEPPIKVVEQLLEDQRAAELEAAGLE